MVAKKATGDGVVTKKKAYIKYFAALLMFGTNGIIASCVDLSSYEIVFTRTLIAGLLLAAIFVFSKRSVHLFCNRKQAFCLLISGMAMGASWMFLYEAYRQMGVGIASLAYYCGPVIVMILSPVLFHERLTWAKAAGFLMVIIGIFWVNIQALDEGRTAWGLTCGIFSAFMYAVMVILNKKADGITGLENAMWQLLAACATVTVFIGCKQGLAIQIPAASWGPILILGIFNTGIGCYFYFSSIGFLPVQTVAVCGYLEPLSAVFFAALLLHERMSLFQVLGAALILGGAAFGELFDASPRVSSKTDR